MILKKVIYQNVTLFDLIIGLTIIFLSLALARLVAFYLRRFMKEKVGREHLEIIVKIVSYAIVIMALTTALPILGVKLSGLLVAGGVVGLAIGFASQSIVGNLISGIFLIIERPVKIGNSVNIDGVIGVVEDIHIMSTTLRTFEGLFIRIPNQKVFTANIVNYVANVARRFEYVVGIRYADDAEKAIQVIKTLIAAEAMALKSPEPQVFVDNLADSSVNLMIRVWAPVSEWLTLKNQLLLKIKQAIEAAGIEIPFPQRVVWLAKECGVAR